MGFGEIGQKSMERNDFDPRLALEDVTDDGHPFPGRKQRRFPGIFQDGHENPGKELCPAEDDIDVPVRDGIEGSGADGPFFPFNRRPGHFQFAPSSLPDFDLSVNKGPILLI
jgi:hypothetical protein